MRSEDQGAVQAESEGRLRGNLDLFAAGEDLRQQATSAAGRGTDPCALSATENTTE